MPPAKAVAVSSVVFPGDTTATAPDTASHINATPESATFDGQTDSDTMAQFIGINKTDYDIVLIANDRHFSGDVRSALDEPTPASRPTTSDTKDVLTQQ